MDPALAAAGLKLEDTVASELCEQSPHNPHRTCNSSYAKQRLTRWGVFLQLLAEAPCPARSAAQCVGCWAAEVELQGRPAPESVAIINGRADFILLTWRNGFPVLRIVECKASSEPQTKFIVQLVLYRMLLLQLLRRDGCGVHGRPCVDIGGGKWDLSQSGAGVEPAEFQGLRVECLLRTCTSGVEGHPLHGQPLRPEEVSRKAQ